MAGVVAIEEDYRRAQGASYLEARIGSFRTGSFRTGSYQGTASEVAEKLTCFSSEMIYKQVCEEPRTSKRKCSATFRWRSECRRIIPCDGCGRWRIAPYKGCRGGSTSCMRRRGGRRFRRSNCCGHRF